MSFMLLNLIGTFFDTETASTFINQAYASKQ